MQYDEIKQLIELFEQTDLTEMELTRENTGLRLSRGIARQAAVAIEAISGADTADTAAGGDAAPAPSLSDLQSIIASVQNGAREAMSGNDVPSQTAPEMPNQEAVSSQGEGTMSSQAGTLIKAPIVGTFYAGSAPDKPPYVKKGDTIAKGDILCIIEAMKFMNEVPSEVDGTVAEILVQDGDFVEFGQPLFRVV